jgi:HAD superfamily hydrolase (TIGR01509 family)
MAPAPSATPTCADMPFDAVIFDCDGVLVASERLVNDIEARLLSGLGLTLSAEEARARCKGRTVAEIAAALESQLQQRLPAEWCYEWGIYTALGFVKGLQPVPGVRGVLDRLAGRGTPLCVASQAPLPRVALCLQITDLARYFEDRVVTAALVPRPKPFPDVFLFAAARMGVEPGRCAVIEDSASGVAAAAAAGMPVFGYAADEDPRALTMAGATIFDHMDQLSLLLEDGEGNCVASDGRQEDCHRLRAAYDQCFAGDPRALVDFLAEDAVYHLPGRHLGGGTLRGRREILERVAHAAGRCDDPPSMRLTRVVGSPETLLSLERLTARRRGRVLDQEVCVVWRMAGDRCAEVWSRFSDQRACDEFWAEP